MKKLFYLFIAISFLNLFAQNKTKTPYDYVNPFIGTDDMGHTYPGAVVPFGLVQLSTEKTSPGYYAIKSN